MKDFDYWTGKLAEELNEPEPFKPKCEYAMTWDEVCEYFQPSEKEMKELAEKIDAAMNRYIQNEGL